MFRNPIDRNSITRTSLYDDFLAQIKKKLEGCSLPDHYLLADLHKDPELNKRVLDFAEVLRISDITASVTPEATFQLLFQLMVDGVCIEEIGSLGDGPGLVSKAMSRVANRGWSVLSAAFTDPLSPACVLTLNQIAKRLFALEKDRPRLFYAGIDSHCALFAGLTGIASGSTETRFIEIDRLPRAQLWALLGLDPEVMAFKNYPESSIKEAFIAWFSTPSVQSVKSPRAIFMLIEAIAQQLSKYFTMTWVHKGVDVADVGYALNLRLRVLFDTAGIPEALADDLRKCALMAAFAGFKDHWPWLGIDWEDGLGIPPVIVPPVANDRGVFSSSMINPFGSFSRLSKGLLAIIDRSSHYDEMVSVIQSRKIPVPVLAQRIGFYCLQPHSMLAPAEVTLMNEVVVQSRFLRLIWPNALDSQEAVIAHSGLGTYRRLLEGLAKRIYANKEASFVLMGITLDRDSRIIDLLIEHEPETLFETLLAFDYEHPKRTKLISFLKISKLRLDREKVTLLTPESRRILIAESLAL